MGKIKDEIKLINLLVTYTKNSSKFKKCSNKKEIKVNWEDRLKKPGNKIDASTIGPDQEKKNAQECQNTPILLEATINEAIYD